PDGTGRLEVIKYHAPVSSERPHPWPPNRSGLRHICIEVNDLNTLIDGLRAKGFDTVGEVYDYTEYAYRLCYLRGPEGLIIELAEKLSSEEAS
ncbi:MAG TPA: VOC family protein, partial [Thermomicrobiales bacterium]|nr:VOC family protein [Thermomicrobiales bacterium]